MLHLYKASLHDSTMVGADDVDIAGGNYGARSGPVSGMMPYMARPRAIT